MPNISVLMPVYNTKEEYLRIAIESILNQTYTDFEFIIINDGSTNNVDDVILSYKDSRIVYIKQENQGIAAALNKGWEKAQGIYIARMDSDDISYPERFAKQVKFLEENPEYSLVGTFVKVLNKNRIIRLPKDIKLMDLLADCTFIHPTIMFKKADFDNYNLRYEDNARYAEDYDLYARAIKYFKMTNLEDVLLDYRVYNENSSTKNRETRIVSSFIVQDEILDYMSDDKKIRESILDIAYTKKTKTYNLLEKIFSIKNLYKNWSKYKLITILGLEFRYRKKDFCRYE